MIEDSSSGKKFFDDDEFMSSSQKSHIKTSDSPHKESETYFEMRKIKENIENFKDQYEVDIIEIEQAVAKLLSRKKIKLISPGKKKQANQA